MQASTVKQAVKLGAKVVQVGSEAERLRDTVTQAVEDTVKSAKRAAKQGREAVEDLVDEATYSIKRHPRQAVGLTLGVGFALGTLFGLALSRLKWATRRCDATETQ